MKTKGFSLVELLVVMAMVAIVATLAGPAFNQFLEAGRLTSTANSFVEALAVARSEAVRRQANVKVVAALDGGNNPNWTEGWNVVLSADDTVIKTFDSPGAGLTFSGLPAAQEIEYLPNGNRTAGAAALVWNVCGKSERGRKMSVSVFGEVSIEKLESGCS